MNGVPPSEPNPPRPQASGTRLRWVAFALSAVLVSTPFLIVTFPPITDLPQQAAQVRLAADALASPDSPYRIQWWTPYTLSYLPIALGWLIGGPLAAGRLGMLLIALGWLAAAHWLAARRGRPAAAAVLASTLVFNHVLYWGFYSFAVGWPLFVIWLVATLREPEARPVRRLGREAALFCALATLLYIAHALWLAAGALWLGVWSLTRLPRWRTALARLAGAAPVLVAAAVWFARISSTSFATPAVYFENPLARLSVEGLRSALYGGLRGRFETLFLIVIFAWFLLAELTNTGRLAAAADRPLALAGALFAGLALALPDKFTKTLQFDDRWMPAAMILLLVAAPAPCFSQLGRRAAAVATAAAFVALAAFTAVTAAVWQRFERDEMSGLAAALAALPEEPRVLGLALVERSRWVEGRPFLQTFAYAQVVHGGVLNFSFAEFAPSLAVFRAPPDKPWTPDLEWLPRRLRHSDLRYFDFLLVGASEEDQDRFRADPALAPATATGRWRLYRIDRAAVEAAPAQ